jgi:hypothetical protein
MPPKIMGANGMGVDKNKYPYQCGEPPDMFNG